MFFLGRAMSALTDEQLHIEHDAATAQVADRLLSGYHSILDQPVRRARAAQREILSRAKHQELINRNYFDA